MSDRPPADPACRPSWRYARDGSAQIFTHPDDVPPGWRDTPYDLLGLDGDGDGDPGGSKPRKGRPPKEPA